MAMKLTLHQTSRNRHAGASHDISKLVAKASRREIHEGKPIVGNAAFRQEAGIHVQATGLPTGAPTNPSHQTPSGSSVNFSLESIPAARQFSIRSGSRRPRVG